MGEPRIGVEGLTVEDCRRLLGEGKVAESLDALRRIESVEPDQAALQHYLGVALHLLGRSKESLPHFVRAHELEPDQTVVYQNQSIALLVAGEFEDAAVAAQSAIDLKPDNIGGYVNLTLALVKLKRYDEARQTIERGLAIAPGHAGLLTQAAHLATETQNWDEAERMVAAALAAAPGSIDAHYSAGMLHQARGRDEAAIAEFDKVLSAQPKHQASYVNKGSSLRNLGLADRALRHFSAGLQIWPDWDVLRYNVAISRLYLGQWAQAWPDYELRDRVAGSFDKAPRPTSPKWTGGDIASQTLLVVHEQGFGDSFQFLRFLTVAAARAGKVIFVCQKRLFSVLSRLELFRKTVELVSDENPLPQHDVHIPLMSLPGLMGLGPDTVPSGIGRMEIEPERLSRWAAFGHTGNAGNGWRIGLSWQGNPASAVDRGRSFPASTLAPLGAVADRATFLSLQRYFGLDEAAPEELKLEVPGEDFDSGPDAFVDTAALMASLDLVITSDTAVAHLAGLLGRPVWLLLKKAPDWRWGGEGNITPWYPTMRVYRQSVAGDWNGVIAEVVADLDRLVRLPEAAPEPNAGQKAINLHMQGKLAEAIEIYRANLGANKSEPQFLNYYGMAVMEEGKRSREASRAALPFAAHSVALRPGVADHWSNLAVVFDSIGSRQDSKRALRYALTVRPDHVPSLISLSKKESADGNGEKALETLKALLARDPTSTAAFSAIATVYTDLGDKKNAERALRRALDLEPTDSKFWVQLGANQSAQEKHRESAESWERALFHEPTNADALSNLGVYERNHGELELSVFLQRRAVECDPTHAEGWNNLGIAELEATRDQAAIGAFGRALAARPGYPDAHLALGMALLNGGDFDQGLKHYEWRLRADKLGIAVNRPNIPYWTGGDPKGLTFFLMAEQGFGDAFQFSRYAAWLKQYGATKVYVGCRKQVGHLLATIPGVDGVFADGDKLPRADAMAYMMSMPGLTGMQLATIPAYESYITANPDRVTRWAEWLAERPGFRVGVVWQGNPDPKVDKGRSYPLAALEPLARVPGVRLIALQKGKGEEQIEALAGRFEVERPPEDFDSGDAFADTAAMMMNLDLIVTSDTAVAHLAGALGRPCWVVLKAHPEWRWLTERSDSPWYPHTRVFRRIKDEVEEKPFDAVMGRLSDALGRLVAGDLSERHKSAPAKAGTIKAFDPATVFNKALEDHRKGDNAAAAVGFAAVLHVKQLRASALHMLGVLALHADRNYRAVLLFREAERAGLTTSEFLTNYSISLRRTGRIDEALSYLGKAIKQKPTPEAYLSRGNILRDECRFDEARDSYAQAILLRPTLSKAHRGMGNLMRDMHRPQDALAAFERAREIDSRDPDLILDHAHAKLFAGDYIGGFKDYEARWGSKEMRPRTFDVPRWDGTPQPDKTLLIHGEQGFGDNIQFVRFVEEAARRVGSVKLEVRGPLMSLFRHLKTDVPVEIIEQGKDKPHYDMHMPMMSLPTVFQTTVDSVPPPARFDIDPSKVDAWRERFAGEGLKVGLIWQGNPKARADQGRSPPLSELEPLFRVPGVRFVSLQKTDGLDQIKAAPFAVDMIVPGETLGDFYETAAAILALDLVISSCTATLHLAATLGVPVYGMLKYHADWRWLNERHDSPWYPSVRLFQQTRVFDWQSAVSPLRDALAERAASR